MVKNAEQLIETYIKDIDDNNWKDFYMRIQIDASPHEKEIIGQVTSMLLQSGIDPLAQGTNLKVVPTNYLYGQHQCTQFEFPRWLDGIGSEALAFTSIENLDLPENLMHIWSSAFQSMSKLKIINWKSRQHIIPERCFASCLSLKEVYLPNHIIAIKDKAFYNCISLSDIYYDGTMLEWYDIHKWGDWLTGPQNNVIVHCIDGETKI